MTTKNKEPSKNLDEKVTGKDYGRIPYNDDFDLSRTLYERVANPDYESVKRSSLAVSLIGGLIMAACCASGNYPFAYIGAGLGLGSLSYNAGYWSRKRSVDRLYVKASGLEAKVQEPYKHKTLYRKKVVSQEWKETFGGWQFDPSSKEIMSIPFSGERVIGTVIGLGLICYGSLGYNPAKFAPGMWIPPPLPFIYSGLSLIAASITHAVGWYSGEKRAKPQYKKVSGLKTNIKEEG
jgi:hypothetical protein